MADRIQLRRGTAAQWSANQDKVLLSGEPAAELDQSNKIKIGDGVTPWSQLGYVGGSTNASDIISGTLNPARLSFTKAELDTAVSNGNVMYVGDAPTAHNHPATEITSGTLDIARIPTGTSSSTVCIGNDARLSDARTPTAHNHSASEITSGTLADARLSANVQRTLLRSDLGTFRSFGPIVMRETVAPRGPNGLTQEQQNTFADSWGFTSSCVTVNSGGNAGTYFDNVCQFGFNVHSNVYNEGSIRLSFESEWTNSGNNSGKCYEAHLDGQTQEGTYFRIWTATVPKNAASDIDEASGQLLKGQTIRFNNWADTKSIVIDYRTNQNKIQFPAGFKVDHLASIGEKPFRQLIDQPTQLYANLPYADYPNSEIVLKSDHPFLVSGRVISTGRVSGTEIRLNDLNYQTIASGDAGGGIIGGYNATVSSGALVHAATGTVNAIYKGAGAIRFYSLPSQNGGTSLGAWGAEISHTAANDETYLKLWHNGQGNWMRVKVGAAGSGPGGTGRALYID